MIAGEPAGPAQARISHSSDVPYLVGQLNSEVESTRLEAGRRLTLLGAAAAPGLVGVFRHGNAAARQIAVAVLAKIGEPALPSVIRALSDPDPDVRIGAAKALATSETKPVAAMPALIRATGDVSAEVRLASIKVLGKIGPEAVPALPALAAALRDASEEVRMEAATALGLVGSANPSASAALRAALDDPSAGVKSAAAFSLLTIRPSDPDAIADVMRLLAHDDRNVRGSAGFALSQSGKAAVPFLIKALDDRRATVRAGAAYALSLLEEASSPAARVLARLLADPDVDVRRNAAEALAAIGTGAAGAAGSLTLALDDPFPAVRSAAADALGRIGPAAQPGLARLAKALDDSDSSVRQSVASALARISPTSGPMLLQALRKRDEPADTSNLARALANVAAALGDRSRNMSDEELDDAAALLQRFERAIQLKSPSSTDALAEVGRVRRSLATEQSRREENRRRTLAYVVAGLAATLLAFALALMASFHLRRRVLVLLGRRWAFVSGQCDGVVEVFRGAAVARPLFESQSIVSGVELSAWPPSSEDIDATRRLFGKGWNVKVIVERSRFSQLWAHAIGSPWSEGADAIIAGQLCFAATDGTLRSSSGRTNIAFAGLACASPPDMPRLSAPEAEIEAAARCHRRWGAEVHPSRTDATISDLRESLLSADIVHVAAHASAAGVHLSDGFLHGEGLDREMLTRIRCRLLVLSACDAGRLSGDDSFVFRLVECGVNIIAAVNPVGDQICRTFFEEFYGALLPSRRAEGVQIGAAVRQAATRCAARIGRLQDMGMSSLATGSWEDSVNSFVLYGDPSAHLVLR